MLALRCVSKLATLIIGNALDVMPEDVVKQVVGALMTKRDKPFVWMSAAEVKLLTERCKYEKYPKGTVLITQGEHRRVLFLVMEGEVEIRVRLGGQGRAVEVSKLGPGDSFGLKSMIIGEGSPATLETSDDCVLVEMTFQVLNSVLVTRKALLEAARKYRLHLIERDRIKYRARWAKGIPAKVLGGAVSHNEENAHHVPKSAPTKEALRVASRTAIHNVVWTLPHLKRFLEPTQCHSKAPALPLAAVTESHMLVVETVLDCLRIQQAEAIFDAGLLAPLLQLLASSSQQVQRLAARALVQLTHSDSFNQKLAATCVPWPVARHSPRHRVQRALTKFPRASGWQRMESPLSVNLKRAGADRDPGLSGPGPVPVARGLSVNLKTSPRSQGAFARTGSAASVVSERGSVSRASLFRPSDSATFSYSYSEDRPVAIQVVQALLAEFAGEHGRIQPGAILEGFQKMSKQSALLDILLRCQGMDAIKRRLRKFPVPAAMVLRAIKLGQELTKSQAGRAVLAGVEDGGDGVPFLDCLEDAMENGGLAALEDKGHGVNRRVLAAFEEFLAGLGESPEGVEGALRSGGPDAGQSRDSSEIKCNRTKTSPYNKKRKTRNSKIKCNQQTQTNKDASLLKENDCIALRETSWRNTLSLHQFVDNGLRCPVLTWRV